MASPTERLIAYFSMEIAVEPAMPTYSGGLGVLAGDTIRSAADMKVPLVAVTLLHRKGYFTQRLGPDGWQTEKPVEWNAADFLQEMPQRASVELEGRTIYLRAWKYDVVGHSGFAVPVYFLDTDLPENKEGDRALTHYLYGGDDRYRLCQEAIFGIGGVRMLRVLGYEGLNRFHMNEGHSALLTLELLRGEARKSERDLFNAEDVASVQRRCVFTTHTPISAGHDRFPLEMVEQVLRWPELKQMPDMFLTDRTLNMTSLAISMSHYVNGVARRHGEISSAMFSRPVESITNGVHVVTWTSKPFLALFDKHFPGWREDNHTLRGAFTIPREEIWAAHQEAKRKLLERVRRETGVEMKEDVLTLGFARRATGYKRARLLLSDIGRLKEIGRGGKLQIVYAGKAHPHDHNGKEEIKRIFEAAGQLRPEVPVVYLADYGMDLGRMITSGVDLWVNTPQPPLEASGTSGMKAAVNGVPSFSLLDGWWVEGHLEGITGWAVGEDEPKARPDEDRWVRDANALYDKLQNVILPTYYGRRQEYIDIMRQSIALNASQFNTERMMRQYVLNAYYR